MLGQDIVVALHLARSRDSGWTYAGVAANIGITPSQVHAAVQRLKIARLLLPGKRGPNRAALIEFLHHGVAYVFPANVGSPTLGVPTATGLEAIRTELHMMASEILVWPHAGGSMRGGSIVPLHRSVPALAIRDSAMHELLALVDCLRLGRVRERGAAALALEARLAA
jgi:hypothetical protein